MPRVFHFVLDFKKRRCILKTFSNTAELEPTFLFLISVASFGNKSEPLLREDHFLVPGKFYILTLLLVLGSITGRSF